MKHILVTGAKGFIGKHICRAINRENGFKVLPFDLDSDVQSLEGLIKQSNFIIHLAGVNRTENEIDFEKGNFEFTKHLVETIVNTNNVIPVIFSSSIQVELKNPYGISKKKAEKVLIDYSKKNNVPVMVYRLENVYGEGIRPNYNSAVATFCYNISHGLDIWVSDESKNLNLLYIGDVALEFINKVKEQYLTLDQHIHYISEKNSITLGCLVKKFKYFKECVEKSIIPDFNDTFNKKLFSVYISYHNLDDLNKCVEMKLDERGFLFELIKSSYAGQIFVSETRPGYTRGNHYHETKVEKFCLIKG